MALRRIALRTLTQASFDGLGVVIGPPGQAPHFQRPYLKNWRLPFATDAAARLQIMRYETQPMRLSVFERHLNVTETRMPFAGSRGVLVVAGRKKHPDPEAVAAFLLDGQGVMLHPGVWHGLDCFPIGPFADFLFLSDAATEDEIERVGAGARTQIVDLAPEAVFEIDPGALGGSAMPPPD